LRLRSVWDLLLIRSSSPAPRRPQTALDVLAVVLAVLFAANLVGCGGSTANITPTSITIQGPTTATVDPGQSASFTATVGNDANSAGVTWTLTGTTCTAAACGTLTNSTTTGVTYTAPATVATPFTVTITVASVASPSLTHVITLKIAANLSIATAAGALPGAVSGMPYTYALVGAGGITPYTWSISQGILPAGLTLDATTGIISGSPMAAGNVSFTVTLADSGSPALTITAAYTLAVVYPALSITTTNLPGGAVGTAYAVNLAASGGTGTGYMWTVTSGTGLSAVGLSLSSTGVISGTPTAGETSAPFTVQVTDANGHTATLTLTLTVTAVVFQGQVLSGQQFVSGATIQLYTVGSTGNGSAATPMLVAPVFTNTIGRFNLDGNYTCGQSSSGAAIASGSNQVYLVATGGGTSTTSVSGNSALIMVVAVGPCTNLPSTPFFTLNEVTTAAAAWALAPFTTSATHIGSTSANTLGITNAFLDASLLANAADGSVATLPANLTIEAGKLSALADALNSCASSANGSTCNPLFAAAAPSTGTAPADIFTAALNIVKNPGQNVAAVFGTLPATLPFASSLIQSPNDWTMSLTVTGSGLVKPQALAVDKEGNVWVANHSGPLSAFNAQGTPLSATGFGAANGTEIIQENGIAIDTSDNIWITNQNGYGGGGIGNIVEFYGASSGQIGTSPKPTGYTNGIYFPDAIAADSNGDLFVANTGIATVTIYNGTGTAVYPYMSGGSSLLLNPEAVAVDASHGFWLPGSTDVVHISAASTPYPYGQVLSTSNCCQLSKGLATDASGYVWVADYLGGTAPNFSGAYAELGPDGTVLLSEVAAGGISSPQLVAVDAAQNAWFSNFTGSITEVAGNAGTATPGTALSPTTGVYGKGGLGLDASLADPFSIVPDRSGNLWICNKGVPAVTMFFGLAAPTATPILPVPTAP
jgi:hypothetical protein